MPLSAPLPPSPDYPDAAADLFSKETTVKYRVKLRTTVTAWAEVELDEANRQGATEQECREWAAAAAVQYRSFVLSEPLEAAGLEHGLIKLAHQDLDESVEVVA